MNRGMKVLQTFALPLGYVTIQLERATGLEPATSTLARWRYQMSYARELVPPVGIEPTTRGFSIRCSTY